MRSARHTASGSEIAWLKPQRLSPRWPAALLRHPGLQEVKLVVAGIPSAVHTLGRERRIVRHRTGRLDERRHSGQ